MSHPTFLRTKGAHILHLYVASSQWGLIYYIVGKTEKPWIPCKYFTLNAVSLTVIAVAMKLPMDLTTPMPCVMDQHAKLGSVAFMCIMMMAFLLPSLATMNSKELVTNIIALGLLVITLVVNVFIQINTGIAVMILKSKEDLESKYEAAHERALIVQQQAGQLTVENLKQHVINYGIMAGSGSPQLMTVCSVTSPASANAEKQQPFKSTKLLENVRNFEGVKKFDSLLVQSLPGLDSPNCWSLAVVTLATITLSLRKIQPRTLKNFLNRVSEGLVYVRLVEESLNNKYELILEWFNEKATNTVTVVGSMGICANSMRLITQTILLFNQDSIDEISQEELFDELSSMISDILAACLTNLPKVIALKCHTGTIEKREDSVHAAATLLGKTTEIIKTLQARQLPNLNPDDLPFIDKWRDHLMAQAP
uniref:Uncharacterized protein n=1 Tax=Tanacetum cinerariifolium TaxID=118510 RepID=A0A6L2JJG7_TANCI|nr:hypothetical protein CTI12_AA467070 [Tanacetum cinerariifolium]